MSIKNNKVVRCKKPFDNKCNMLNRKVKWWWDFYNFPAKWLESKKLLKFEKNSKL